MNIATLAVNAAEKRNLMSAAYKADMPLTATRLLLLLIDRPGALLWSTDRLAKALKRSVRTVERAIAKLVAFGAIKTVRRARKLTMLKVLQHKAILTMASIGAAASRKACETRRSVSWRVLPDRWRRPISNKDIISGLAKLATIAKVEKSDASASLLRSVAARPG